MLNISYQTYIVVRVHPHIWIFYQIWYIYHTPSVLYIYIYHLIYIFIIFKHTYSTYTIQYVYINHSMNFELWDFFRSEPNLTEFYKFPGRGQSRKACRTPKKESKPWKPRKNVLISTTTDETADRLIFSEQFFFVFEKKIFQFRHMALHYACGLCAEFIWWNNVKPYDGIERFFQLISSNNLTLLLFCKINHKEFLSIQSNCFTWSNRVKRLYICCFQTTYRLILCDQ